MTTKKELLERIRQLERRIAYLENMHAIILPRDNWEMPAFIRLGRVWEDKYKRVGYYNDRQLTGAEVELQPHHPQPKHVDYKRITNVPTSAVDTERVSDVTLEELARLVIDGKPIRREERVVSKRISKYTEDTTIKVTVPE